MAVNQKLTSIQLKIDRASKHITVLEQSQRSFFDSKPYEINSIQDEARKRVYYLSKVELLPSNFAVICGDAINNLRSALDHLAWQLFLVNGENGNPKSVFFPIADAAIAYNDKLRKCSFKADAMKILLALQPYKGGKDELLWVLHSLNNIDKHRLIVTVGSAYQAINLGQHVLATVQNDFPFPLPKWDWFVKPKDKLFPLEKGKVLFVDGVDAKEIELQFMFSVDINEIGILEGKPMLETLKEMLCVVKKTVAQLEPCII